MRYVSTRGGSEPASFEEVLLSGTAPDGGLYVPETWPTLPDLAELRPLPYSQLAATVIGAFTGDTFENLDTLAADAYRAFRHPDVAPLRQLSSDEWMLELFWGPTLSFKDYALQLVGRMVEEVLSRRESRLTFVAATSGDTGSAAIEAVRHLPNVDIVVLHPAGRISAVQRRQMTTVDSDNVLNLAVDGTFDDCQDAVKAIFSDPPAGVEVGAVNSINWARIAAQVAYHVSAVARVPSDLPVAMAVPTGNFGNVYAAYVARAMGAPIGQLLVGCNENHGLTTLIQSGRLPIEEVVATAAPAMDIQVPSNLERLMFDLFNRDGAAVARAIDLMRAKGELVLSGDQFTWLSLAFSSVWLSDGAVERAIAAIHDQRELIVDPHTAIAITAGRAARRGTGPTVAIATAHPAKFPDIVAAATGVRPSLPDTHADLMDLPEHVEPIEADAERIRERIGIFATRRGLDTAGSIT